MIIEITVDDNSAHKIIKLLESIKDGAIKELKIKKSLPESEDIFEKSSGILAPLNIDPLKWQEEIRDEWNR